MEKITLDPHLKQSLKILYKDEHLVAIEKPAGFFVHPPEDSDFKISNNINCLYLLKHQLGQYIYPVHRLDRATSGIVLFALNQNSASQTCKQFREQTIKKVYYCIARGWVDEEGEINHPLTPAALPSLTIYKRLACIELPYSMGKHTSTRYSLVRVMPHSGRMHQIRRHFAHLSHPLIGDTVYGDGAHNRLFRETLNLPGLLLKAYSIEVAHPTTEQTLMIHSRWNGLWHRAFELFEICPFEIAVHPKTS